MNNSLPERIADTYRQKGFGGLVRTGIRRKIVNPIVLRTIFPRLQKRTLTNKQIRLRCSDEDKIWRHEETVSVSITPPYGRETPREFEEAEKAIDFSPRWVCELTDAMVCGHAGTVITEDGEFVLESIKGGRRYGPEFFKTNVRKDPLQLYLSSKGRHRLYRLFFKEPTRIDTAMSMVTHTGTEHPYGHWLLEYLPMLLMLSVYEEETGREPTIIVNKNPPDWMLESLRVLGYSDDRLMEWTNGLARVNRLVLPVTSANDWTTETNKFSPVEHRWLQKQFRSAVADCETSFSDRIYVSRQGLSDDRHVANFDEIKPVLDEFGFDIIRPEEIDFLEQLKIFSKSSLIVGPQGSGLHNMLFAENAGVVELFPGYISVQNYILANELGHSYTYIIGDRDETSVERHLGREPFPICGYVPFRIDPQELRTSISRILEDSVDKSSQVSESNKE